MDPAQATTGEKEKAEGIGSFLAMLDEYTKKPEMLAEYLKKNPTINVNPTGLGVGKEKLEWNNSILTSLKRIDVFAYRRLSEESLKREFISEAIACFTHTVSPSRVGAVLCVATALRPSSAASESGSSSNNNDILDEYAYLEDLSSNPEVEVPTTLLGTDIVATAENPKVLDFSRIPFKDLEAQVGYTCASAIRLIRRSAASYKIAWEMTLPEEYRKFYKKEMTIKIRMDKKCLESIRSILQDNKELRNAIVPFLYGFEELKESDKNLCKMLFEEHVRYTGMHSYPLFMDCARSLCVDNTKLMSMLCKPPTSGPLRTIKYIIEKYEFPVDTLEAKQTAANGSTWKYSRIFDENAFWSIQTKTCWFLAAVLARLAKKLGIPDADNALALDCVSEVSEENIYQTFPEVFKIAGDVRRRQEASGSGLSSNNIR